MNIKDKKIEEVLTRGVRNIYSSRQALETVLKSGKKLRIYCGIDPTGKLHLGHGAVLGKLRQFQDLGHEVIVLIGDFTATIGDPTGKHTARKMLTREQVLAHAKNYKKQIRKILDFSKSNVRFLHNEEWTNKLKPIDMLAIASKFTVARLLERDMFQRRIKAGRDIHVHEFLYPIFQAYDAVTMDVDMQIGGSDQTFNMLAGRTLMKKMKNKETFVLTTKLLVDPTGKKMGKTEGDMISLDENPEEIYGRIMSWPDTLISLGFELCTRIPMDEVKKMTNSRDAKARLAREIVRLYHGERKAKEAEKEFERIFAKRELPSKIKTIKMPIIELTESLIERKGLGGVTLLKKGEYIFSPENILANEKIVKNFGISKSEFRRLFNQKAVKINGKKISSWDEKMAVEKGAEIVLQLGKRRFLKIKLT